MRVCGEKEMDRPKMKEKPAEAFELFVVPVASNALRLNLRFQGRLRSLCFCLVILPPPVLCWQPEQGGSIYGSAVSNVGQEYDASESFYNKIQAELDSTKVRVFSEGQ